MKSKRVVIWGLLVFYIILFLPYLGSSGLFDWDEVNFAEVAREMIVSGNWLNPQINFQPFWEKPPLFMWIQAISMSIFGINSFAARFPNVLIGAITLWVLFNTMANTYGKKTAILSVLLYIGSITPHVYFRSGIIDPLFNLFIFTSVLQLIKASEHQDLKYYLYSGTLLGLAVLTKGPVSVLIVALTALFYSLIKRKFVFSVKGFFTAMGGLLFFPLIWLIFQVGGNGWWFVQEFLAYQLELLLQPVASHGRPIYYHPLVLLIGCFPLFILAIPNLYRQGLKEKDELLKWMRSLFWVVLILFSLVTTKIIHYTSLCYLPLAVLAARWTIRNGILKIYQKVLILIVGGIWSVSLASLATLNYHGAFKDHLYNAIADPFAIAQLEAFTCNSTLVYALSAAMLVMLVYVVIKYETRKLPSYLLFHTLVLSLMVVEVGGAVNSATQKLWTDHLETYTGKKMFHFTYEFKSYAYLFYTKAQYDEPMEEIRRERLESLGYTSYRELDWIGRAKFDHSLREYVIQHTDYPLSITVKLKDAEVMHRNPMLHQVFEGNGYVVFERK